MNRCRCCGKRQHRRFISI